MTPTQESRLNNRLLASAIIFAVIALALGAGVYTKMLIKPEKKLYLVTHDITVDITTDVIVPADFVAAVHGENPFNFEVYPLGMEDPLWMDHYPLECNDLGETYFWVRVVNDGYGVSSNPTKATLTVTDVWGQCGDPQLVEDWMDRDE